MTEELIEKIKNILTGIDEMETESAQGWWETSAGADFGKSKLAQVVEAITQHLEKQ